MPASANLPFPSPSPRGPSRIGRDLIPRLLSALVAAPLALFALWQGGGWIYALAAGLLGLGLYEWTRITAPPAAVKPLFIAGLTTLVAVLMWSLFSGHPFHLVVILPAAFLWILFLARRLGCRIPWVTAFGAPYLSLTLVGLHTLQTLPHARELTLMIVLMVWAVDSGAYFAGRLIGGPKLSPRWSPNKTWSGLIGGMGAAALVGGGWAWFAGARLPEVALFLGAATAVVAQLGDIGESILKRTFGIKDSGTLFPGHGGALDRVDGLLLAVPVFALFQVTVGRTFLWW